MLVKMYVAHEGTSQTERKYSPSEGNGTKKRIVSGEPNAKFISTSYIERPKLNHAYANAPFYPFDKCFQPRRWKTIAMQ